MQNFVPQDGVDKGMYVFKKWLDMMKNCPKCYLAGDLPSGSKIFSTAGL